LIRHLFTVSFDEFLRPIELEIVNPNQNIPLVYDPKLFVLDEYLEKLSINKFDEHTAADTPERKADTAKARTENLIFNYNDILKTMIKECKERV
jgi:hypothetical protein